MILGSDLEWNGNQIGVYGLAWDGGTKCSAAFRTDAVVEQYFEVLRRADRVVGQNFVDADCRQLAREGHAVEWLERKVYDIRIAMHAVNGHLAGTGSYDLRSITLLANGRQGQRFPLDWKDYKGDILKTCAFDAASALWNYETLERQVRAGKLEATVQIGHDCAPIFARMRDQGVRLDKQALERIYNARKRKTQETVEKYHLWEERGKKVIKKVPIWRSDKILDICEKQFGFRPKDRQRNTWLKLQKDEGLSPEAREFVDAVVDLGRGANDAHWLGAAEETEEGVEFDKVGEDGFIYPRYDLCGSPDRAIASNPNVQNFPRPKDDPRVVKLRSAVVPLYDSHVILGVDFSSVETITNAIESDDWDRARDALAGKITHEGTAALVNAALGTKLDRQAGKAVNHGFDKGECVAPDTLVLKADLTWVPAADLQVGDEIVGFDENFHGKKSKYRRAVVEKISQVTNPCYLVETDHGSMTASANHAWLVRNFEHVYKWRTTDKLKVGRELKFFGTPWSTDTSYEAGCLAGFFDGEGAICRNGKVSAALSVCQNTGGTLDRYRGLLHSLGYSIREKHKTHKNSQRICAHVTIRSRYDAMRFLGSVRPVRLLGKAHRFWENASVAGGRHEQCARITRVTYIGEQETIAIKTSTKTLITNGFLTHNSPYNLARTLFKSERPSRQAVQQCRDIFESMLKQYPKTAQFRDHLWERAADNPLVVQNSFGRRLMCFSRSKYGDGGESRFAKHDARKKYWCSCSACGPRRDRWKYAIAFLGRSAAFDALLRKMRTIWYDARLDQYSLPYLEVHDELDYSIPRDKAEHYARIAKECFEEPIPELGGTCLPASVVIGENWAEAH